LAANRWPFRLHATYNESIERFLNVFEEVNREVPFDGLHWFFDHAETITDRNIERVKALGGGIAIQHRMAYQGEYFVDRYGAKAAERTPPIAQMLKAGVVVGAGTDATRVASYNPFMSLYWLVTGNTIGGLALYPDKNRLDRREALRLYTVGSAWFSGDEGKKGSITEGALADLAVLSEDYFHIPEEAIKDLVSVLTIVGGKPVYGAAEFESLAPPALPVLPDWSPVVPFGGYALPPVHAHPRSAVCYAPHSKHGHAHAALSDAQVLKALSRRPWDPGGFWGAGCDCFAF
jgi:predicted amidohydrolase YtcJ